MARDEGLGVGAGGGERRHVGPRPLAEPVVVVEAPLPAVHASKLVHAVRVSETLPRRWGSVMLRRGSVMLRRGSERRTSVSRSGIVAAVEAAASLGRRIRFVGLRTDQPVADFFFDFFRNLDFHQRHGPGLLEAVRSSPVVVSVLP